MVRTSSELYGVTPDKETTLQVTARSNTSYGMSFPIGKVKGANHYDKETGLELIKNNIEQLILTEKGERVMLPQFGMSLKRFLFQPITEELFTEIKYEVLNAIRQFVPNVEVARLRVTSAEEVNVEGGMGLNLNLSLIATQMNNTIFTVGVKVL